MRKHKTYDVPEQDKWIVQSLLSIINNRLLSVDSESYRQGLLRLLFAFQRLPECTPGINLSVEIDNHQITITEEVVGLYVYTDDGHTMFSLEYFESYQHCIHWCEKLTDDEKKRLVGQHLSNLTSNKNKDAHFHVEDYSTDGHVDSSIINTVWGVGTKENSGDKHIPQISKGQAKNILKKHLSAKNDSLIETLEIIESHKGPGGYFEENYIYQLNPSHEECYVFPMPERGMIGACRTVIISKETGKILFDGPVGE